MRQQRLEQIHRINYLVSEMDALYHQASLRMGIPDSVTIVLYTVLDNGGSCLLSDVYKGSGTSKQTVNSAIRRLEADGTVVLEQHIGRSKRLILTEAGEVFAEQTVGRLFEAEARAFDGWTDEEIDSYINRMAQYTENLRLQFRSL